MKKYHIEMEVVTPLSVGAGNDNEWAPGVDFVQKDGKVYVLDIQKAMKLGVDVEAISKLFLKSDVQGICKLLGNRLEKCSKYIFRSPESTSNSIKAFQRTQFYDLPVVAGSSLKGAVRSTLFKHFRSSDESDDVAVFGNMKDGTDFMRFIHISDFEMLSTILVNTKLFNLQQNDGVWQGGWKHGRNKTNRNYRSNGFNTLYECVEPGQKGYGNIVLDNNAYDLLTHFGKAYITHADKKTSLIRGDVRDLFGVINSATRGYLVKERAFFENYSAERSEELIDCIDELLNMIPNDNSSCLIKMSAGVGFHSITGDWKYEDYSKTGLWDNKRDAGKKKYKSRKTAEYNKSLKLMGFVKLRCIDENEAEEVAERLQEMHLAIISGNRQPIKEREPERILTQEERAKRDASVAEMNRKDNYRRIIEEAKLLSAKKQWDEAIAKANEAASLFPDKTEPQSLIEECEKAKNAAQFLAKQNETGKEKFKQPLDILLKGLSSVGNIIGTTSKWLKSGNAFGEVEYRVLLASLQGQPAKEIKKKWKDVEKVLPKDWNDELKAGLGIQ